MSKNNKKNSTNPRQYGPEDRSTMEKNEKGEVINTGLPNTRMDDQVQVNTTMDSITKPGDPGETSFEGLAPAKARELKDGIKLRPCSTDTVLKSDQVGGVPIESGVGNAKSAAGAFDVSPVHDTSRKPYTEGNFRPDSRPGKITGQDDFIINNTVCEQIESKFKGSKDLKDAPDKVQGYDGRKQFTTARGKKNAGDVPQSTLFERGADFVYHDATIHTTGQVLDNIEDQANYPTQYFYVGDDEHDPENKDITDPMKKSNYLLKSLNITLTDGKISAISFNEDMLPSHVEVGNAEQANLNWQVDANNVTKAILKMQIDFGRETTGDWTPLAYVINQVYKYNMLAHDIEATTGAMMLLAYRAAVTSIAFRSNNLLYKDGAKPVTPIADMFLSGIGQLDKSVSSSDIPHMNAAMFDSEILKKGSAAAIIRMFDSTAKFTTKANFFNLQKGLKYLVQKADNNIDPLHCKKDFLMALDTVHTFSTPTGEYSPVLPIYATDKISIVNPLSLNYFLRGWSRDNVTAENPAGTANIYVYHYNDLRNIYDWNLKHPLVEGLVQWLIEHESGLSRAYGDNAEITIPAFFSMLAPSMFQEMLCAASQKILLRRNVVLRDWLFVGDMKKEYAFPDLKPLSDLNPLYSSNMKIHSFSEPLDVGKLKPASAIQLFWGESYAVAGSEDPIAGVKSAVIMMPWYHNEAGFKSTYDSLYGFYQEDPSKYCKMSYPELREGVNHEYIDYLYGMSERDVRLCLDRAIGFPLYMKHTDPTSTKPFTIYEKDSYTIANINSNVKVRAMRYDLNSDGRIIVEYKNLATKRLIPNKAGIMCLPRELGYIYPALRVSPIITNVHETTTGSGANTKYHVAFDELGSYNVSKVIDGSQGVSVASFSAMGDNVSTASISRTAALQQDFITCFADRSEDVVTLNEAYTTKTGMLFSLSSCFTPDVSVTDTKINARCELNPFYNLGSRVHASDLQDTVSVLSLSKYLWTLLNRVFLPNNPFENNHISVGDKEDFSAAGVLIDPLEPAFFFGVAGFLASDFAQDVLNRSETYEELNLDYTEDLFIKDSLIFRED